MHVGCWVMIVAAFLFALTSCGGSKETPKKGSSRQGTAGESGKASRKDGGATPKEAYEGVAKYFKSGRIDGGILKWADPDLR
ncbi:MAG: hypothetical protein MUC63_05605, partial [Planctomycetes bacterium]|nr:hypothetical protein [Planctomycetota bacterium]